MLEDVTKARRTLSDFSRFLRGMFRKENRSEFISVEEELQIAEYYLRIEKVRYGDNLEIKIDVPNHVRSEHIVPITIQPLVENSVKHGFKDDPERKLSIVITAGVRNNRTVIEVTDNGPGIPQEKIAKIFAGKHSGIGVGNTLTRLRRAGGDLIFENIQTGLKVIVVLPQING